MSWLTAMVLDVAGDVVIAMDFETGAECKAFFWGVVMAFNLHSDNYRFGPVSEDTAVLMLDREGSDQVHAALT